MAYMDPNTGQWYGNAGEPIKTWTDPKTGTVYDAYNHPIQQGGPKGGGAPVAPKMFASPEVGQAFETSQNWLDVYGENIPQYTPLGDLSAGLERVGAYKEFDWQPIDYERQSYEETPFTYAESYQAPEAYQAAQFDFTGKYQPPEAYQATQYQMPEIADIERLQPSQDEFWAGREASEREKTAQRFADTRERIKESAVQGGARPEQMAAIEANLGIEENKAQTEALRNLDIERAREKLQIGQQEQQLAAGKATTQAGMDLQTQELAAQEMAKKYGLDIENARYLVQQDVAQQQAQAGEASKKYGFDVEAAQFKTGLTKAEQEAQSAEKKYGFEAERGEERFGAGLSQYEQEQKAAEKQKAYESKYGLAQDVAQTDLAKWQAEQQAKYDRANAILQGEQAASQTAAQLGTYETNLTPEERAAQQKAQTAYNAQQKTYANKPGASEAKPVGGAVGAAQNATQQLFAQQQKPKISTAYAPPKSQGARGTYA
jgi:hypothetical protein